MKGDDKVIGDPISALDRSSLLVPRVAPRLCNEPRCGTRKVAHNLKLRSLDGERWLER